MAKDKVNMEHTAVEFHKGKPTAKNDTPGRNALKSVLMLNELHYDYWVITERRPAA